jgi:hypothetical protein
VELVGAEISFTGELRLVWRCLAPLQTGDTIFVHLWRGEEFVGNADGESLGGLVPVSTWQAGTEILDRRSLMPALAEPGVYAVRVGLYNRDSGTRYPAVAADGALYNDGEVPLGTYQK